MFGIDTFRRGLGGLHQGLMKASGGIGPNGETIPLIDRPLFQLGMSMYGAPSGAHVLQSYTGAREGTRARNQERAQREVIQSMFGDDPYMAQLASAYPEVAVGEAMRRDRTADDRAYQDRVRGEDYAHDLEVARMRAALGSGDPAAWREWQHFSALSLEDQQRYLRMKRAQQIATIDQVPTIVDPVAGSIPLSTLGSETAAEQAMSAAGARGGEIGAAEGQAAAIDIPGSEAQRAFQVEEDARLNRERNETMRANQMSTDIQNARDLIARNSDDLWDAFPGVTGAGAYLRWVPGSSQRNLAEILDTVRANVGFDRLNQMRAESPTGGALGQVTERELKFLQSVAGSLEQAQRGERLLYNLDRLDYITQQIVNNGLPEGGQIAFPTFEQWKGQRGGGEPSISDLVNLYGG